jgi:cytochrome c oxidase accessory protein FixG
MGVQSNLESPKSNPRSVHRPTVDSVTTINEDGSRYFLHPADSRGDFLLWRRISAWALIIFYLAAPWVPVDGYPAVFLDVAHRRFHFFGYTLAAQDAWLLFFLVTGLGFSLFFITALLGRIWCGWACPQTVFLEHVYRRIERLIEGDAPARRAMDLAPLSRAKFAKRTVKHAAFIAVSLVIAHLFLAYFVSIPELWGYMRSSPGEHWAAFVFVFLFAGILYFNFAWFREQLCIVICPYGRLQSALTDDHTLTIGYDAKRGEPRGKLGTPDAGACVACNRCVQVCPTGIDIRHGLQLECIGCAACIDACDEVMAKVHRPTGLIRYDSFAGLGGGRTKWIRPRTLVYAVLLFIGAAVATFAFRSIKPANFLVFRMGGGAYFVDRDVVRNQFMVRLLNKRSDAAAFAVEVEIPPYVHRSGLEQPVTLAAMDEQVAPLVLTVDRARYAGSFKFLVRVRDVAGQFTLQREVEFLGPDPRLLQEEDRDKGIKR